MIVLPELWDFMKVVYEKNLYEAQQTKQYKLLKNIYRSPEIPIAIPYWSLFDNTDYVDCVIYDVNNITYEDRLQSFVFKNLQSAFLGIELIFKKLQEENPTDYQMKECCDMSRSVIRFLRDNSSTDELSGIINDLKI
jgi:hypothetical protein